MAFLGGRGKVPNEHLGVVLAGVGGDLEHLRRHLLGDVGLAAILANIRRNFVDDDRLPPSRWNVTVVVPG